MAKTNAIITVEIKGYKKSKKRIKKLIKLLKKANKEMEKTDFELEGYDQSVLDFWKKVEENPLVRLV